MILTIYSYAVFFVLALVAQSGPVGVDLRGLPVERLVQSDTRLVVLMFTASDCPISNRYVPEITRLRSEYGASNVAFWWVFPNPADTAEVVVEHERQFAMEGDTVLDTEQRLVRFAHVQVTPEVAVFRVTQDGLRPVYHGAVDDLSITLGKERPLATRHYLADAIAAALAGRAVAPSVTRPVGCSIVPIMPLARVR